MNPMQQDIVTLAGLVAQLAELLDHYQANDETRALASSAVMFASVKVAQHVRGDGLVPPVGTRP